MATKMGDEKGLMGGFSASDLMTMACAKDLPKFEAELVELKVRMNEVRIEISNLIGKASDEQFASLVTESEALRDKITRQEFNVKHAQACARYVVDTLHREPW